MEHGTSDVVVTGNDILGLLISAELLRRAPALRPGGRPSAGEAAAFPVTGVTPTGPLRGSP